GPLVVRLGFVLQSQGGRCVRPVVVRLRQVWLQRDRSLDVWDGLGGPPLAEQQCAEVCVGHPRGWTLAHCVAPERLRVGERVRSRPRRRSEREQETSAPEAGERAGGTARELPDPCGRSPDEQRDQTDAGLILEVVGNEGVAEGIDIDEAERRCERDREVQESREWPSPDPSSQRPRDRSGAGGGQREEPLPPRGPVDLPARVDEREPYRDQNLCGVEPDRAPGD